MNVLKSKTNGRLFLATPKMMRNNNLTLASEKETKAYLAKYKKADLKKIEESKRMQVTLRNVPENFDWDVNVTLMDESAVRTVAAIAGVDVPANMSVSMIKTFVKSVLKDHRPEGWKSQRISLSEEEQVEKKSTEKKEKETEELSELEQIKAKALARQKSAK